jgi:hypothetical protein
MKTSIVIQILVLAFCFSCSDSVKTSSDKKLYDIYPDAIIIDGDTVNKSKDDLKYGRWVTLDYVPVKGNSLSSAATRVTQTIVEDGYYKNNKKDGYWKIYERYTGVIDTVLYVDGIQQSRQPKTYTVSVY